MGVEARLVHAMCGDGMLSCTLPTFDDPRRIIDALHAFRYPGMSETMKVSVAGLPAHSVKESLWECTH